MARWPYLPNHVVGTVHVKDDELEARKRHGEILSELRNAHAVLAQCCYGQILLVCTIFMFLMGTESAHVDACLPNASDRHACTPLD